MTVRSLLPSSPFRILVMLTLALFFAGATGCVSQGEYKSLETAHRQAMAQLAEAENDLNAARAKIADLEARLAALGDASGGFAALKQERDALAARLAELEKKYQDLLTSNASTPALPADVNAALEDFARKYPGLVEFEPGTGMVRFKSDLTFELGSTVVRPNARTALAEFAQILNIDDIKTNEIQCVGHTDDVPIRRATTMTVNPTNQILSTNRGWAVAEVLYTNGVAEARVTAAGWGEQRPIVANAPGKRGAEPNRRVDVYIRPTKVPEGITISTPGPNGELHTPITPHKAPAKAPKTPKTTPITPAPATTEPAIPRPVG